jgi:hypothetical protein
MRDNFLNFTFSHRYVRLGKEGKENAKTKSDRHQNISQKKED